MALMKALLVMVVVMCIAVQVTESEKVNMEMMECAKDCRIMGGDAIEVWQCKRFCRKESNAENVAARKASRKLKNGRN